MPVKEDTQPLGLCSRTGFISETSVHKDLQQTREIPFAGFLENKASAGMLPDKCAEKHYTYCTTWQPRKATPPVISTRSILISVDI